MLCLRAPRRVFLMEGKRSGCLCSDFTAARLLCVEPFHETSSIKEKMRYTTLQNCNFSPPDMVEVEHLSETHKKTNSCLYCKYSKTGICQVCRSNLKFSEINPCWPLSICFHNVPLTYNRQPPDVHTAQQIQHIITVNGRKDRRRSVMASN